MIRQDDLIGIVKMVENASVISHINGKMMDEDLVLEVADKLRDMLIGCRAFLQPKRVAIVKVSSMASLEAVQQYIPSNYTARLVHNADDEEIIRIEGYDRAGWTMDGYILPNLASGLIFAKELTANELNE